MKRRVGLALASAAIMGVLAVGYSRPPAIGPVAPAERSRDDRQVGNLPHYTVPPVRVLLASKDGAALAIQIDGPYRVTAADGWGVLAQGDKLAKAEVTVVGEGLKIGAQEFAVPRLEIEIKQPGTLWVGNARYRGRLRLVRRSADKLAAINLVEPEDYVASVVNGEMPGDFPIAAREAQAIVARTYAVYQMKVFGPGSDFDVYDNTRSQMYRGVEYADSDGKRWAVENSSSREIAERTRGLLLAYQGRVFCAYYGAVCGGHTLRGRSVFADAAPPLVGVACEYCSQATNYRWERVLPRDKAEKNLATHLDRKGRSLGELRSLSVDEPADRSAPRVVVAGSQGREMLTSAEFRAQVAAEAKLPSSVFTIEMTDEELRFHGRGWGHCVGLCQWGARGQALAGRECAAILAHYYPGSELITLR